MPNLIFIISLALLPLSALIHGSPTLNTFMYKYCSTANLDVDPNGMFSDTRQSLLQQLLPHSSHSKFYRAAVVPDRRVALWGHFQCRGDLTADECHSCVNYFSNTSSNSWCANSLAARVQLYGCHIQYEADGSEIPGADLTHNRCGEESAEAEGDGFQEAMSAALAALESGVMENLNGYCSVDVGGVYAAAQCAEGLSGCDCGECVEKAAEECEGSLSAHVYMDMCSLSFEFRPTDSNPATKNSYLPFVHQEQEVGWSLRRDVSTVGWSLRPPDLNDYPASTTQLIYLFNWITAINLCISHCSVANTTIVKLSPPLFLQPAEMKSNRLISIAADDMHFASEIRFR